MRIAPMFVGLALLAACTHHAAEQKPAEPVSTVDPNRDIVAERLAERAKAEQNLREAQARVADSKAPASPTGETIRLRTSHLGDAVPYADAYYLALTQLTDQYAVFSESNVPFVVAIERGSIDSRIAVTEGMALIKMTHCVQWQRDETWQSDRGFPLPVKVYKAVWCD